MKTIIQSTLNSQRQAVCLTACLRNIADFSGKLILSGAQRQWLVLFMLLFTGSVNAAIHYNITLKTSNNHYVVAENNGGSHVNANRGAPGPWEHFTLIDHNGGTLNHGDSISIQTGTGHYFQAGHNGGHDVSAVAPHAHAWETFTIEKPNIGGVIGAGDKIAIRTGNGRYFRAPHNGGSTLDAQGYDAGCGGNFDCSWEMFEIDINYSIYAVSFASGFNGKCLDVDPANNNVRMMDCNGAINQLFIQHADGTITSLMNNYCLDSYGHYGNFFTHPCHGGGNQKWDLAHGQLKDLVFNHCADVYAFNNNNGANVQMYHCTGGNNQRWHMLHYNSFENYLTAPPDQTTAINEELFVWSYKGNVPGMQCYAINEFLNNQAVWNNNYLCTTAPHHETGLQYSMAGPVTGKRCTHLNEGTHSWGDNFLCVDRHSEYVLGWDWADKRGPNSLRFNEPGEVYWNDNYLSIAHVDATFIAPWGEKAHDRHYHGPFSWNYFFEDVIFDAEFYCPLLNFGHYLGYAWAGCHNPTITYDYNDQAYVIQSPHGSGYRGGETLQTRIKDLRVEMDASTISLGQPIITPSSTQQNVKTATYTNESYTSDSVQEFRVQTVQQNCWSRSDQYTFGQSVSVTGEKKWKTAASEVTTSITIGVSFEQAFSETSSNCSTNNETIVTRVIVPPRSRVIVSTAAITGQVTIPYTAKVNLGYTVSYNNFLRWGGNARNDHPTNRPYYLGVFGQAGDGAGIPFKGAPEAIIESYNERNSLHRQYVWDWNWMLTTYGSDALRHAMSGITRKHVRNVNGQFHSDGVSYVTTIGAATPL